MDGGEAEGDALVVCVCVVILSWCDSCDCLQRSVDAARTLAAMIREKQRTRRAVFCFSAVSSKQLNYQPNR